MCRTCRLITLFLFALSFSLIGILDDAFAGKSARRTDTARTHSRSLDDDSTIALTLSRDGDNISLNWINTPGAAYWKVLRGQSSAMTAAETLAVTLDTFWLDPLTPEEMVPRFYQVLPLPYDPPTDTVDIIQDFENDHFGFGSIPGEDQEPDDWNVITSDSYEESGHCLHLFGNTWKSDTIDPVAVEFNTVWQVAFKQIDKGEIQAIGIADSLNWLRYIIWGSESPESQIYLTTYQGWFTEDEVWTPVYLPIGEDWHGRFGYLPRIRELQYINDNDGASSNGEILIDEIRDVTETLPYRPQADFRWELVSGAGPDSVRVQFTSLVYDPDSPLPSHRWDFGDGIISDLLHPSYDYPENGRYTVTLTATDLDDNVSWQTHTVEDPPVTMDRQLRAAFTGDIILARGYESSIIPTYGVEYIFAQVHDLLEPLDLTSVNLECPFTTATTQHPTKGIVFKSNPSNVAGLTYIGTDFASLANNHIIDYMEAGLQETMFVLDTAGIIHTGANMNDVLARRARFISRNGLSLAMLAFSDRTGQYNNLQPFLDAGRSRPGFAMWNRSAIEATIPEADELADFVILNVHSGSEYKYEPQVVARTGLEPWDPEIIEFEVMPDTTERLIRQYAIENGADLVVTHHPHVMQGFEVYQGKLIAHSMGNFAFDLTFAECFPSCILHTRITADNGIDEAVVHPVYLDRWIPTPATGGLGQATLDYESEMSRRLNTWLVRQPGEDTARIIWDTTAVFRTGSEWEETLDLTEVDGYYVSQTRKMSGDGYAVWVEVNSPDGAEVRVGRDVLWFGNMEDEGATPWNLNSDWEDYSDEYACTGQRSVALSRLYNAGDNVMTNLLYRKPFEEEYAHTALGWIRTENAGPASIQARLWTQRSSGTMLLHIDVGGTLSGNNDWTYMEEELEIPGNSNYFDIRMSLYPSIGDTAFAWFDDIALVQWQDWETELAGVPFPSYYTYYQVRSASPAAQAVVHYRREWIEE